MMVVNTVQRLTKPPPPPSRPSPERNGRISSPPARVEYSPQPAMHQIPEYTKPPTQAMNKLEVSCSSSLPNQDKERKELVRSPPPPCHARAAPPIPNKPPHLQRNSLTPPPSKPLGNLSSVLRMSTHSLPDYGLPGREHPIKPPAVPSRRDSLRKSYDTGGIKHCASNRMFEERFRNKFKHLQFLPVPDKYTNCDKTYPSRNVPNRSIIRQNAPFIKPDVRTVQNNSGDLIPRTLASPESVQRTRIAPTPPPLPKLSPKQPLKNDRPPTPPPLPKTMQLPAQLPKMTVPSSSLFYTMLQTSKPLDKTPSNLPSSPKTCSVTRRTPPTSPQLAKMVPAPPPPPLGIRGKKAPQEPGIVSSQTIIKIKNTDDMKLKQSKGILDNDSKIIDTTNKENSPVSVKKMAEKLSNLYRISLQGDKITSYKAGNSKPPVVGKKPTLPGPTGPKVQIPQALIPKSPVHASTSHSSSPSPPPAPLRSSSLAQIPSNPPSPDPNIHAQPRRIEDPLLNRHKSHRAAPPPPAISVLDDEKEESNQGLVRRNFSFRAAPPPPVKI